MIEFIGFTLQNIVVCVLLLFVCICLVVLWKRQYLWGSMSNIPGPFPLPFLGNTYLLLGCNLSDCFNRIREMRRKYGKTMTFYVGSHLLVSISDPVAIEKTIANKTMLQRSEIAKIVTYELFRDGLLLNSGDTWRYHRKIMSPMFYSNILEKFVGDFSKNANILANRLREIERNTLFDTYKYVLLSTVDTLYETILGTVINAQQERRMEYIDIYMDYLEMVGERIRRPWLFIGCFFRMSKLGKKSDRAVNFLYDIAKKILEEKTNQHRTKILTKEGVKQKQKMVSIIDLFIESGEFSEREILEEMVTLLLSGSETTATVLCFTLAALGEHQDVQDKVMEEQIGIYGDDLQRPVSSEDLNQMVYLEQVIKEVIRLFPPITFLLRTVNEDTDLGNGYVAPKGSNIAVMSYETHRDPELYPDPERFDPERFSPENSLGRHPYAYIPFGAGRRSCIGYKFAMMELKTMLSVVLRRHKIVETLGGLTELSNNLQFGLVLKSSIGYKIYIEPR